MRMGWGLRNSCPGVLHLPGSIQNGKEVGNAGVSGVVKGSPPQTPAKGSEAVLVGGTKAQMRNTLGVLGGRSLLPSTWAVPPGGSSCTCPSHSPHSASPKDAEHRSQGPGTGSADTHRL